MQRQRLLTWGPIAVTAAFSLFLISQPWINPILLFRDPPFICEHLPSIDGYKRYFGFVSLFGVFGWVASAAICLFGALLLKVQNAQREIGLFYIVAGLLTAFLALDDQFLIHEYASYKILYGREVIFYGVYLVPVAAYGLLGIRHIFGRGALVFWVAAGSLMASVVLDLVLRTDDWFLSGLEDVAKLTGIMALLVFHITCLLDDIVSSPSLPSSGITRANAHG